MTTALLTTTIVGHTTTAEFRVWGAALSALLAASGLTKAGDAGQIDLATATLPAAGVAAGYEIWYLNDSLHGSAPLYFKIEYGTHASGVRLGVWITAASGTNGAGTVSGTTYYARAQMAQNSAVTAGTYPSFACTNTANGFVGFSAFRRVHSGIGSIFFAAMRTTDTAGVPTATGFNFYTAPDSALVRNTYVGGVFYGGAGVSTYCCIPGEQVSTIISGNIQIFRHFSSQPAIICVPQLVSFYGGEISTETTFTATPVGVTARTYLALSDGGGPTSAALGGATPAANRLGMLWE